jgi:signal peptidase I
MTTARPERSRIRRLASHPLTHLVAAFVVLAMVQTFVIRLYQVPSASMEPTFEVGDRILTSRVAYVGTSPATGDIVVFHKPDTWDTPPERGTLRSIVGWAGDLIGIGPSNHEALTKRVVASGGQTVSCCDDAGRVIVDGSALDEPYVIDDFPFVPAEIDCSSEPASLRCFPAVTLRDDELFVLGDNRSNSSDSATACRTNGVAEACARLVPSSAVVGKVVAIAWPVSRWGTLPGAS